MKDSELYSRALAFAAWKHRSQTRRDGETPYITHPLAVADLVRRAGGDTRTQVAALLHDTLEDTDATENEILEFGPDVLEAVKLLTRPEGADEDEYVEKILKNPMAAMVKNADKLHNLSQAPFCEDREWAKRYVEKSRRYYGERFSPAVDKMIGNARSILSGFGPTATLDGLSPNELSLLRRWEKP